MMSLWDALRMNMMISYQELVRTFPKVNIKIHIMIMPKNFTFICSTYHRWPFTINRLTPRKARCSTPPALKASFSTGGVCHYIVYLSSIESTSPVRTLTRAATVCLTTPP
ncbi:hypothetical protein D4N02_29455 [Klebsiella pneumoniae]|nr:hypothetical protein D4N02_29455 [Klebsiella pneumoniae]